jgi:GNAT superfamily N-acetyltransferase
MGRIVSADAVSATPTVGCRAVSLQVRPVHTRSELKSFIKLPFAIHRDNPVWVPPLLWERKQYLDRKKNPYFEHADAEYFIAWRDGQPVGRITAMVDRQLNDYHGWNWGTFGFFECLDDQEAATALVDAADAWVRARGCDRLVGPMDFTMNDEVGILIEGFDLRPMIKQPWHPPYYQQLMERQGLVKAHDLLMWNLEVSDRSSVLPVIDDLAAQVEPKHHITLRHMSKRDLQNEIRRFVEVYNAAWSKNWGFTPISENEMKHTAKDMKFVLDEDWTWVAEYEGETVGVALTIPDFNQAIEKANGRLFPFGWARILLKKRSIDRVRVGFLGVKPEYQHTGVAAAFYVAHFDMAAKKPQDGGEMGWILESNKGMNRGMEAMGGRVVKKYRLYERVFES